jgi:hypothetical protein
MKHSSHGVPPHAQQPARLGAGLAFGTVVSPGRFLCTPLGSALDSTFPAITPAGACAVAQRTHAAPVAGWLVRRYACSSWRDRHRTRSWRRAAFHPGKTSNSLATEGHK